MEADILAPHFQDEDKAREFLEAKRWPDGTICPHCGVIGESFRLQAKDEGKTHVRKGVWKCNGCREQFSVTVGTVMEDSHIPLNKWLLAFHLLCASKKGMSAHQLHRMLGVTYKSAWFMAHRIRHAMTQEPLSSKLDGVVEIDEAYIGGKRRRLNNPGGGRQFGEQETQIGKRVFRQKREPGAATRGIHPHADKEVVLSLVQRGGKVRSLHMERVTQDNLRPVLNEYLAEGAHVMTDSACVLSVDDPTVKHDRVNHTAKEYVRYENGVCISTNTVEGYFATLKRGIDGVYHHVGRQHLNRYLNEFDFRYNSRDVSDVERATLALKGVDGKRLTYRDSCGKGNEAF
ncbi:MAG TPA: IS1595 family transposase [Bryobacteraceae bacterium]|nr:IS1595 family transposase [Bryobacteraceae bacterium]